MRALYIALAITVVLVGLAGASNKLATAASADFKPHDAVVCLDINVESRTSDVKCLAAVVSPDEMICSKHSQCASAFRFETIRPIPRPYVDNCLPFQFNRIKESRVFRLMNVEGLCAGRNDAMPEV